MARIARFASAISAIGSGMDRIRMYQSFVLYSDSHRLPVSARRRLGLED